VINTAKAYRFKLDSFPLTWQFGHMIGGWRYSTVQSTAALDFAIYAAEATALGELQYT